MFGAVTAWSRRILANQIAPYLKDLGASEVDLQRLKNQDLKLGSLLPQKQELL